jgi:hypothetical protein
MKKDKLIKIYAPPGTKSFVAWRCFQQKIKSDLKVKHIPNGIIAAWDKRHDSFGVLNGRGRLVKSSLSMRGHKSQLRPDKNLLPQNISYVDEDVVYWGDIYNAFGEFLLITMSRAWSALDKKYAAMKIVLIAKEAPARFLNVLEVFGIKRENIIVLRKATRFRNVFVPEQGFEIPFFSSAEYANTFRRMADNIGPGDMAHSDKIYVSRAKMGARKTFGEEKVQGIFEKNGFEVIYPEKLPLTEQIRIMKNCKVLAGIGGTALHMALFMPDGGTLIQIKRTIYKKDNIDTQVLINRPLNIKTILIAGSIERIASRHNSDVPQIIGMTRHMRKFFDDFGFAYDNRDLEFDREAWGEYAAAIDRYQRRHGSLRLAKIKHAIIVICRNIVPGRMNRRVLAARLKKLLHA